MQVYVFFRKVYRDISFSKTNMKLTRICLSDPHLWCTSCDVCHPDRNARRHSYSLTTGAHSQTLVKLTLSLTQTLQPYHFVCLQAVGLGFLVPILSGDGQRLLLPSHVHQQVRHHGIAVGRTGQWLCRPERQRWSCPQFGPTRLQLVVVELFRREGADVGMLWKCRQGQSPVLVSHTKMPSPIASSFLSVMYLPAFCVSVCAGF